MARRTGAICSRAPVALLDCAIPGPRSGTLWTNGRAERFIGTIQRECAYRDHFTSDEERALAIALFVPWYNTQRPHHALGGLTPQGWLDRWRVTHV